MKKKERSLSALLGTGTTETESYKFRLPVVIMKEIKAIADTEYRSLSDQITFILAKYIESRGQEK